MRTGEGWGGGRQIAREILRRIALEKRGNRIVHLNHAGMIKVQVQRPVMVLSFAVKFHVAFPARRGLANFGEALALFCYFPHSQ